MLQDVLNNFKSTQVKCCTYDKRWPAIDLLCEYFSWLNGSVIKLKAAIFISDSNIHVAIN